MNQKKVLFVSSDSIGACVLVEKLYSIEADKMDVSWTGTAKSVQESSSTASQNSDCFQNLPIDLNDEFVKSFGFESIEQFSKPEELNQDDLSNADITIYIKFSDSPDILGQTFPNIKGKCEVWTIKSREELLNVAKTNISKLLVLLIMKGGKRTPLTPELNNQDNESSKSKTKDTGKVRVCLEKKKRRGKKVTTISGLPLNDKDLYKLAASLKQSCGTGGTVKDGSIEIQGDQCDKILAELANRGYKAKRSGG